MAVFHKADTGPISGMAVAFQPLTGAAVKIAGPWPSPGTREPVSLNSFFKRPDLKNRSELK